MNGGKSLVAVWRDAVRDGELSQMATLVGLVLSTFMNGSCFARPSRSTLARGAKCSDRTVDAALAELERALFLVIERTSGGNNRTNRYQGTLPPTAKEVRRSEWASANVKTPIGERHDANRERPSHESAESGESGALDAAAAFEGAAASPRGVCIGCGENKRLVDSEQCVACSIRGSA